MTNAQAISRIIKKTGIRKSETGTTRIPGYHITSEGFVVTQSGSSVVINYEKGDWNRHDDKYDMRFENAKEIIKKVLTDKGYEVKEWNNWNSIFIVRKVGA